MVPELPELAGVIHCHSTFSDGFATVAEILQAAQRAGLQYLILTDHDTLAGRESGPGSPGQGYHGGLLFLVGSEVSPPQNHYLSLGAVESPPSTLPLQEVIDRVTAAGGLGFVAHPYDKGNRGLKVASYPWNDQAVTGYTGIEVWNFFSHLLGEALVPMRLLGAILAPYVLVRRPQPETLELWDRIGQSRRVPGIGGTDAHGINRPLLRAPLVVTNYTLMLRTIWTHVLLRQAPTGDWQQDGAALLEALAEGRAFLSSPSSGDAHGFRFTAESPDGLLQLGEEGRQSDRGFDLGVTCPLPATIRLVRDGRTLAVQSGVTSLRQTVQEPGVYRVEVYRRRFGWNRLWILSNPIYLRP
ncbi:MAG: CehA/McbA family metallohydrolase [Firmicutes bacterium]|nr:CehA/McbA family metallohydrolase [Bacillota bacterium]